MNKATMMMVLLAATSLATLATPQATASQCSDTTNNGVDWHYNSCTFSCPSGSAILAQSDSSQSNYVDADAKCGGAEAGCSSDAGYCEAPSDGLTTSADSSGSCKGSTYVPWTSPGGKMVTTCWSNVSDTNTKLLVPLPTCEAQATQASSAAPSSSFVVIYKDLDTAVPATAFSWNAVTGCVPIPVLCSSSVALLPNSKLSTRLTECKA